MMNAVYTVKVYSDVCLPKYSYVCEASKEDELH